MASRTRRISGAQRYTTRKRKRKRKRKSRTNRQGERGRKREREYTRGDERCGPRMTFQPEQRRRPENREGKNKSTGRANDVSTVRPTGAITNGILQSLRLYLPRRLCLCACLGPVSKKWSRIDVTGVDNRLALQIENHSRNAANQTVSTWNLISALPSASASYATRVSTPAGAHETTTTTERRRPIRYRALYSFCVPSAPFVSRFRYARLYSMGRVNRMPVTVQFVVVAFP